jgi:tetratricopeptide (TPR) repeat protein
MIATRHWLGAVLLVAAALLGGCASPWGDMRPVIAMDGEQIDMQDPTGRARALVVTGQYGLAIDELTRIVDREPKNVRALALLATAYDHLKRYDLADRYHAQALQVDPNSVAALNNWGYSYLVRGDKARAMDLLERAVAVDNTRPIVTANLALASNDLPSSAPSEPTAAATAVAPESVRLSEHVTLVRRVGHLVRLSPGVQMLVTTPESMTLLSLQTPVTAEPPAAKPDSRFELFRQLSALMEGSIENGPRARDSTEVAQAPPFTSFPDVDDFSAL